MPATKHPHLTLIRGGQPPEPPPPAPAQPRPVPPPVDVDGELLALERRAA